MSPWELHGVSSAAVTDPLAFFGKHGLFYQEDAVIGNLVHTLDEAGKPSSPESFRAMKKHIEENPNIRSILERYLTTDNPKVCLTFGSDIGHIFVFSITPTVADRLVLHTWAPGSHVIFYESSYKKDFQAVQASNGLLEVAEAAVKKGGCNEIAARMDKGGFSILHPRYAFQIVAGFTNTYGLEIPPEVAKTSP